MHLRSAGRAILLGVLGTALALPSLPRVGVSQTADDMSRAREAVQDAFAARERGDIASYRDGLASALRLRPGHPELLYYLASALALAGDGEGATAHLRRIADMGLAPRADLDPDFQSLADEAPFRAVLERLAENGRPKGNARLAFTIPGEPDLIPEGIAYDPTERAFFIGSVRKRTILRVDPAGEVDEFAAPGHEGMWSVMGMVADPERRHLWVCTAALPETDRLDPAEAGRSAVLRFDLDSGELLARYRTPDGESPQVLGDLALAADGTVYVSDARGTALYVIRSGGQRLESLIQPGTFASPQGLALGVDPDRLYVADYSKGVFVVNPSRKTARKLTAPADAALLGIDGLAWDGQGLIAVQNGTTPHRVLRLHLGPEGGSVSRVEVMAAGHPDWDEPTLGVVVGARFYFVANSQWNRFEDGELPPVDQLADPRVMWIGR